MNTQRPRFNLNNFKLAGAALKAIAPMAIILVGASPLFAQVVTIENFSGAVYRTPANNSIIYTHPISSPVNSSIIYGSPIPAPSIIYPTNFYSYPSYYPGVRDTTSVLVNPTIRDSTLINPTIINIQPQRRYRLTERKTPILRPINY